MTLPRLTVRMDPADLARVFAEADARRDLLVAFVRDFPNAPLTDTRGYVRPGALRPANRAVRS